MMGSTLIGVIFWHIRSPCFAIIALYIFDEDILSANRIKGS